MVVYIELASDYPLESSLNIMYSTMTGQTNATLAKKFVFDMF